MFELLEQAGVTLGEVIGAVLVFAGIATAVILFKNYGYEFITMLAS